MGDPSTSSPSQRRDLRKEPVDDVLRRIESGLGVELDQASMVRKRRSVGARSDRGTWVRVEIRSLAKIAAQAQTGNGLEAAESLNGVAKPAWHAGLCWHDADVVWRADEVDLIADALLQRTMLRDVSLSQRWWATLNASLDALSRQRTTRIATPDTEAITQELVTTEIDQAFPNQVDTTLPGHWTVAHADLNWANLTWPECWIIDWEDHGMAPRGLDSATLWASSLGIGELAETVWHQRRTDLETKSGTLMGLFCCAKILNDSSVPAELRDTATRAARTLIAQLPG